MDKRIIGFLLFVILTSSYYILLPDSVRVDIQDTKSLFKVYENDNWVLGGTEWTNLFDGTKKMRASSRSLNSSIDGDIITILRSASYKDNITVNETYTFNANTTDPRFFPIDHKIRVTNGQSKILRYEVTDLLYTGMTVKGIESPQCFGHDMKVEWDTGNYYSKIYKYFYKDKGKLTVKYKIENETAIYNVRLFDPPTSAFNADDFFVELLENEADLTYGYGVFKITNNLNKPIEISNETISALFDVNKGELLSYKYSIIETVEEQRVKKPKTVCYEQVVNTSVDFTRTGKTPFEAPNIIYSSNGTVNESITETVCKEIMRTVRIPKHKVNVPLKDKKVMLKKGESIILRIDGTYTPNSRIDWKPTLIIDNVTFVQHKYAWWDAGWGKRKLIAINVTQNVTNHQFFNNLTYDSDMQSNGDDLRVVCYNNMDDTETQTSYWIESKSDGNWFLVGYNCSANTYNGSQSGVYYGNTSSASSLSNLTEVFWWGDTAEVGTYTDSWTFIDIGSGTAGYNANHPKKGIKNLDVNITGGAGNGTWVYRNVSDTVGDSKINATYTYDWYDNNVANETNMFELNSQVRNADASTGLIIRIGIQDGVNTTHYTYYDIAGGVWVHTTVPVSAGFHKIEVRVFNGNYTMFIDETYCGTFTYTTTEPKFMYFGGGGSGIVNSKGYYDDIRIRKYIYPEPTYVVGAEESPDVEDVTVTLNNPVDNNITSELTITFNATGVFTGTPLTCDLFTNESGWSLKHTNTTTIVNDTSFVISETFSSDGDYIWNIQCNDTDGNASFASSNWVITIDTSTPSLYITFPTNTTYITNPIAEISAEDNIDSCWYSINDGTNYTITDCGNGTMISAIEGSNKLILYVNDSLGLENSSTVYFTKQEYQYYYIESFINSSQVLSTENMSQRIHMGDKNGTIMVGPTWGGNDSIETAWSTVHIIDGVYHMWYSGLNQTEISGGWSLFYANSTDGWTWVKPNFDFYGDNTLYKDINVEDVIYDPLEGNVSRKFKFVFGYQTPDYYGGEMGVAFSEDGLTLVESESNRVVTGPSTGHENPTMVRNLTDNTWIFPMKYWSGSIRMGKIYTAEEINGSWTDGPNTIPGTSAASQMHSYHVDIWGKYYYGFIDNISTETKLNITFYFSDNAINYTEIGNILEGSGGEDVWDNDSAGLSASRPLTISPDGKLWLNYYNGRNVEDDYSWRVGLATWRKGGIVGYNLTGTNETGTLTTRIVNMSDVVGDKMLVNVNASLGSLKMELIGNESTPLSGYSESDFDIITTDVYNATVTWGGSSTLPSYDFKVKMYLNQSEVFEFWFVDSDDVGVDFTYITSYIHNETVTPSFEIYINSPANNTNTSDSTPDFNFTINGTASTYGSELFINGTGYGVNGTVLNDTATVITANDTLSDGIYNWYINYTIGVTTNQSEIRTITINTTGPTITIYEPTNTTYNTTTINLNVDANETVDIWWYELNSNGTNVTFNPNTTITGIEGQNNITVWANDTFGNENNAIVYFTIDTTPPQITINNPENISYYDIDTILLNVSVDELLLNLTYVLNGAGNVSIDLYEVSYINDTQMTTVFYEQMVIDSNDDIHIVFGKSIDNCVYYAFYNGSWIIEEILNVPVPSLDISVNSTNIPHIVYIYSGTLRHAYRKNATNWTVEILTMPVVTAPRRPSMDIDSNDDIHISFWDNTNSSNSTISYGKINSSGYFYELVDYSTSIYDDDVGDYNDIKTDSNNIPHIIYRYEHQTGYKTKHAYYDTSWVLEDSHTVTAAYYIDMVIVNDNIYYSWMSANWLAFSTNRDGSWVHTTMPNSTSSIDTSISVTNNENLIYVAGNGSIFMIINQVLERTDIIEDCSYFTSSVDSNDNYYQFCSSSFGADKFLTINTDFDKTLNITDGQNNLIVYATDLIGNINSSIEYFFIGNTTITVNYTSGDYLDFDATSYNGTFAATGQNDTTPGINITNDGNVILDINITVNTTHESCFTFWMSDDSTLNTTTDYNVTDTIQNIVASLAIGDSITLWVWMIFNECTPGTYFWYMDYYDPFES